MSRRLFEDFSVGSGKELRIRSMGSVLSIIDVTEATGSLHLDISVEDSCH